MIIFHDFSLLKKQLEDHSGFARMIFHFLTNQPMLVICLIEKQKTVLGKVTFSVYPRILYVNFWFTFYTYESSENMWVCACVCWAHLLITVRQHKTTMTVAINHINSTKTVFSSSFLTGGHKNGTWWNNKENRHHCWKALVVTASLNDFWAGSFYESRNRSLQA